MGEPGCCPERAWRCLHSGQPIYVSASFTTMKEKPGEQVIKWITKKWDSAWERNCRRVIRCVTGCVIKQNCHFEHVIKWNHHFERIMVLKLIFISIAAMIDYSCHLAKILDYFVLLLILVEISEGGQKPFWEYWNACCFHVFQIWSKLVVICIQNWSKSLVILHTTLCKMSKMSC